MAGTSKPCGPRWMYAFLLSASDLAVVVGYGKDSDPADDEEVEECAGEVLPPLGRRPPELLLLLALLELLPLLRPPPPNL